RVLQSAGSPGVIVLRRLHSFGLGESHVDELLSGIEALVPDGSLKLGFRAHYPQLETKLTIRAATREQALAKLAPVEAEVRRRVGNFILATDDETLEGVVLVLLGQRGATLAVVENFTGGHLAARLAPLAGADKMLARGTVALTVPALLQALPQLAPPDELDGLTMEFAERAAEAARQQARTSHGLALLCTVEGEGPNLTGSIVLGIAAPEGAVSRRTRLVGNRDWIRLGAAELGLDSLRRHLQGLPLQERIDFEKRPGQ
ncbi:MAG TPA: CinA family protein, partial [bacterium]|nr:CinA family protein [bacterium]